MKHKILIPIALIGFTAGCKELENSPSIVISHVDPAALSTAYVTDWSVYEAAAAALRNTNPLYTVQKISGYWGGSTPASYSLAHGKVEYAHAAGLTGAGQVISIVDFGFLRTHETLAGKTVIPGGSSMPVDDHGTGVAAVAAGSGSAGTMIGVAPGATLALGNVQGWYSNELANDQARILGAVAQNNSWGLIDSAKVEVDATQANFDDYLGSGAAASYFSSLKAMSQNTIVVFAVSNDETRTTMDLMAGLPMVDPSLRDSWISVINAIPVMQGGSISSATVVSSDCLQAAAWCMAADGTVYTANDSGNSSYSETSGSSFAAPQVAGGLALLAEAFPTLSRTELRARMLASADNSFYSHTGYVEFADGLSHGFNSKFGHGFMDLQAALSPIGGSYVPRANGNSAPLGEPTIASTGMAGDVLRRSLSTEAMLILDGMGAEFDVPANLLTAGVVQRYDPLVSIENLFSVDLNDSSFDPLRAQRRFASVNSGQQVDFEAEGRTFSLLLPTSADSAYGISLANRVDVGAGSLEFGISAIQESSGFAGIKSLLTDDHLSSVHGEITVAYNVPLGRGQDLLFSGRVGMAMPSSTLTDMGMTSASYNAFGLSYSAGNVLGTGDRLSVGLALPNAIQSGTANVTMPVARSGGGVDFTQLSIPLAATARQLDISATYGLPLFDGSDIVFSAVRSLNDGNVAGKNTTEAGFGFRFSF